MFFFSISINNCILRWLKQIYYSLFKLIIYVRVLIIAKIQYHEWQNVNLTYTYPIPDRWRMCTISYLIPRWRTAISWGVSAEARIWYTTPECIDKRSKNLLDWKVHITLKTQAYDLCSLLFNIIVFVECPSCPDWK